MEYDLLKYKGEYKTKLSKYPLIKEVSTNYSVRFEIGRRKIMLNETGERNEDIFTLMNECKNDARKYLKSDSPKIVKPSEEILWCAVNEYEDLPKGVYEPILKIDLSEAYWRKGVLEGIISKKTEKAFKSLNYSHLKPEEERKQKKLTRLKAFGSLATIKTVKIYKYGKLIDEWIECEKPLRSLYMAICELVANDMQEIITEVGGLYYYWDCLFVRVKDNKENKIVKKIQELGYKCTVEKDNATVIDTGDGLALHCEKSDVEYPLE